MAPDKSLAAEIEAATERERTRLIAWLFRHPLSTQTTIDREMTADALMADFIAPRLVEIAALRSRAFEDGARWMRERAADRVKDRAYLMEHGEEQAAVLRAASDLAALPLQPEGERNA